MQKCDRMFSKYKKLLLKYEYSGERKYIMNSTVCGNYIYHSFIIRLKTERKVEYFFLTTL